MKDKDMVRVRYWVQETMESGKWALTGLMPEKAALDMIERGCYEQGQIVREA